MASRCSITKNLFGRANLFLNSADYLFFWSLLLTTQDYALFHGDLFDLTFIW